MVERSGQAPLGCVRTTQCYDWYMGMSYQQLLQRMQAAEVLRTPEIVAAFKDVVREDFLPLEQQRYAGEDRPLPIGHGQTNSQPSTVAFMLEQLQPRPGHNVLDVGAGSGWTSALLGHAVGSDGQVTGVELVGELVDFARSNLNAYDYQNVDIKQAGAQLGWPKQAPYDRILVSAAGTELPEELLTQLASDGRMVIPVGNFILCVDKGADDDITVEEFPGFAFVPLRTTELE